MKIGINISQIGYKNTGVANFVKNLVENLINLDKENEYILFFSSLRKKYRDNILNLPINQKNVKLKTFKFPPVLLDLLWNRLHLIPIEFFIGKVDIFLSSDWTEPPTIQAKKATILYDLIVYKYPEETHNITRFNFKKLLLSPNIVASQKRKLYWTKKECDIIFCISESTRQDANKILGIPESKLQVIYPG